MIKEYVPNRFINITAADGQIKRVPAGADIKLNDGTIAELECGEDSLAQYIPFGFFDEAIVTADKKGAATLECRSRSNLLEALKAYSNGKIANLDQVLSIEPW